MVTRANAAVRDATAFLEERAHFRYLRGLIESNPIPVVLLSDGLRILTCNCAFEQLFQFHAREIVGRKLDPLVSTPDLLPEANRLSLNIMAGRTSRARTRRRRADGTMIDVEVYAFPLMEEGRVIGGYALYQDIGEQRRAERALDASEERYRSLVQNAHDFIYTHDLQGRFTSLNPAGEHLTGFTVATIPAFPDLVISEQRSRIAAMISGTVAGKIRSYDLELVAKNRRQVAVEVRPSLIHRGDGADEIQGIGRDVTERRRVEASLRLLSGRLLRLQDEERRRIAVEMHDGFGQTITALSMYVSAVRQDDVNLRPEACQALAACAELTQQCLRELRTFSYLLHPPLLDEIGLISALRWFADGFSRRSGIAIALDLPAEVNWRLVPEAETALFRVAQESLTNVHRHSGSRRADLSVAIAGRELVMHVRDFGCGFVLARPESTFGVERLGLGILGMRQRMKQLDGRLEIESSRTGTLVTAALPLHAERI